MRNRAETPVRPTALRVLLKTHVTTIATWCMALLPISCAYSQDKIEGCWKVEEITSSYPGSSEMKQTPNCFNLIEADRVTMGCVGTNARQTFSYEIEKAGVIVTAEPYAPQLKKSNEYLLEDGNLTFLFYSNVPKNSREMSATRYVSEKRRLSRVALPPGQTCLPPQLLVSREDFARYYKIPQLMAAHPDHTIRPLLAMTFAHEQLKIKSRHAVRPEHVRRLLTEFDKITDEFSAGIRKREADNPSSLTEAFFATFKYDPAGDRALAGNEKQKWANDVARELIESRKLFGYFTLIAPMFSEEIQGFESGPNRIDKSLGIGETYLLSREFLQSGVFEALPDGFLPVDKKSLIALRELSRKNEEIARSRNYYALDLGEALGKAVSNLPEFNGSALGGIEKDVMEKLQSLATRFRYTLDPLKTGACNLDGLDQKSAAASGGDWRKVKKTDGTAITQSSDDHYSLFEFFILGCGGKKDYVAARKALFDTSGLESKDSSKRGNSLTANSLCTAEIWARYGIGGRPDEKLAREFARRYAMSVYFIDGDDSPAEREKVAKKYPAAAAESFGCPAKHQNQYNRIDPRDPWKDLW